MPIEPLLFGDNRSSRAGEDHLVLDQDPSPHTIFSSISTYLIRKIFKLKDAKIDSDPEEWKKIESYFGPFKPSLENTKKDQAELYGYCLRGLDSKLWFPKPQHFLLKYMNKKFFVGEEVELKKDEESVNSTEFKFYLDAEPFKHEFEGECFISESLLQSILTGKSATSMSIDTNVLSKEDFFQNETRLGIWMDDKKKRNVAKTGMLFSRPYRRFNTNINYQTKDWDSVSFYAWYKLLKPLDKIYLKNDIAFLGGDRRRVIMEISEEKNYKPLKILLENVIKSINNSKGFFAYLLTPAVREKDWPVIENTQPLAAAIGKEKQISGWNTDIKNQSPRPILKLIPAGSIFFYEWPKINADEKTKIVNDNWFEPISERYRSSGFGRILIGVWS